MKNRFYEKVSEDTYNIDVALLHKYATEYDVQEDVEHLEDELRDALAVARDFGDYWDDLDPRYPNNPYNWGFTLDDFLFVLDYTGVAGKYWNDDETWTICRPW